MYSGVGHLLLFNVIHSGIFGVRAFPFVKLLVLNCASLFLFSIDADCLTSRCLWVVNITAKVLRPVGEAIVVTKISTV